ncbi:hypothetical protein MTBSS4_710004 [Magnetospirillum sp. SS-4]|nr:hypothetical protein MTBSS4_710004 [Magnetospirillum sp. SS-4]
MGCAGGDKHTGKGGFPALRERAGTHSFAADGPFDEQDSLRHPAMATADFKRLAVANRSQDIVRPVE